ININLDAAQFGRNWVPDLAVCADAKVALGQLLEALRREGRDWSERREAVAAQIAALKAEYRREVDSLIQASAGPVHPALFLRAAQEALGPEDVVVLGEGATRVWTATELNLPTPGNWVSASDYGCMGYANAAAMGAAVGRPGAPVWCFTGDGSFQMQMQELATAAQYGLPIAYVVFNNSCLGWIKWGQAVRCEGRHCAVDFEYNWDFVQLAQSAGVEAVRVDGPEKIPEALALARRGFAESRPVLLEVLVPWNEQTPGFVKHHGTGGRG
ncbi:MAG: thiamine pyrophosphate-binding protein, partial [Armatimonadetes bacterium]|nr:thiamine pyrophosphate-binding protein [Armatimonadota bacterium]